MADDQPTEAELEAYLDQPATRRELRDALFDIHLALMSQAIVTGMQLHGDDGQVREAAARSIEAADPILQAVRRLNNLGRDRDG